MHNLVIETTRMGIEVKNLKMRVESLASRLEFNERRARALESVVVYKPATGDRVSETAAAAGSRRQREAARPHRSQRRCHAEGPGQRSRRRRRRRGRRGGGSAVSMMGAGPGPDATPAGQPTTMRSDAAAAPPELPEPAHRRRPANLVARNRSIRVHRWRAPDSDDSGRGAGEPDGEQ